MLATVGTWALLNEIVRFIDSLTHSPTTKYFTFVNEMASHQEILESLENIKEEISTCYAQVKELNEHRMKASVRPKKNPWGRADPNSFFSGSTQQNEPSPANEDDSGGTLVAGLQNGQLSVDDNVVLPPGTSGFLEHHGHIIERLEKTLSRVLSCITSTTASFIEKVPTAPTRGGQKQISEEEALGTIGQSNEDGQNSETPQRSEGTSGSEALAAVEVGRVQNIDDTGERIGNSL